MNDQDIWLRALQDEGIVGTPLEAIANKTRGFESGGRSDAVSNRGARGQMQIMPGTFTDVADQGWDFNDPYFNTRAGLRYLKKAWEASGGDPALTGAYYYGGPGGMAKARQGIAVSDPQNPNYPTTIEYGKRLASAVEGLFPAAHAGTLPQEEVSNMQVPQNPNAALPATTNQKTNSMLPNAMATLLGLNTIANAGGEFRSQDAAAIAPEAIESLNGMRESKARMLPIALGALMSSNSGANQFGQNTINSAISALDPIKMNNGMLTPDGQYITDVDGSALARSVLGASKGVSGKTIPTGELGKIKDEISSMSAFKRLADSWDDSFTNMLRSETFGDIENTIGKKFGLGLGDQASFWMDYQELINAVRNKQFGSALTETERAEFEKAIVRPGMDPKFIKSALDTQARLLNNGLQRQSMLLRDSGYNTNGIDNVIQTVIPTTAAPAAGGGQTGAGAGEDLSIENLLKLYGN